MPDHTTSNANKNRFRPCAKIETTRAAPVTETKTHVAGAPRFGPLWSVALLASFGLLGCGHHELAGAQTPGYPNATTTDDGWLGVGVDDIENPADVSTEDGPIASGDIDDPHTVDESDTVNEPDSVDEPDTVAEPLPVDRETETETETEGSDHSTDEGTVAAIYSLDVEGAYGGGMYPAGAVVHLFGALDPTLEHNLGFEVLEGNIELQNADEWHATLIMPANDVRVRYRSESMPTEISEWVFPSVTGNDTTLRYHRSSDPVGIVFLLHGTGGSSRIIESVEARAFVSSAVARGYTVVAPEAEESVAGDLNGDGKMRWNVQPRANNVDFQNLNRLVSFAKDQGWAHADTPFYVVGMSNGGAMSMVLGAIGSSASALRNVFPELRFGAVVSFCAASMAMVNNVTETPSAWYMAANDNHPQVGVEAIDESEGFYASLLARGIDADFAVHDSSPLFDERFVRVPGIDVATSRALVTDFENAGFLDEAQFVSTTMAEIQSSIVTTPSDFPTLQSLTGPQKREFRNQLMSVTADHQLFSDLNERVLDFLDRN